MRKKVIIVLKKCFICSCYYENPGKEANTHVKVSREEQLNQSILTVEKDITSNRQIRQNKKMKCILGISKEKTLGCDNTENKITGYLIVNILVLNTPIPWNSNDRFDCRTTVERQ